MFGAKSGGGLAGAGKKAISRTKMHPMTGSSCGPMEVRRYRPTRFRISSSVSVPLASPKNSQASEMRSSTKPL